MDFDDNTYLRFLFARKFFFFKLTFSMDIKESQILMDNWLEWRNKNNIDLLRLDDMQDMLKLNVNINIKT